VAAAGLLLALAFLPGRARRPAETVAAERPVLVEA